MLKMRKTRKIMKIVALDSEAPVLNPLNYEKEFLSMLSNKGIRESIKIVEHLLVALCLK